MASTLARHTPSLAGSKTNRALSFDSALLPHFADAVTALATEEEWEEVGDSVAAVVAACKEAVESWYGEYMIGQVSHFVDGAPVGWLEFDGTQYTQADYPELFDKLPSGWISGTNFTLPDLEDVFIAGVGAGGTIAATGGANSVNLTVGQLPAHTHSYSMPVVSVDTVGVGAPLPVVDSLVPSTATGSTGSGDAVENRPVFLLLVIAIFAGRE